MQKSAVALAVLAIAGCASAPDPEMPISGERVSYELINPAYCGDCDGTTIVAAAAGQVWVEKRSWQRQSRPVRRVYNVSPEGYRAFSDALAAYRPPFSGTVSDAPCSTYELHSSTVRVTWTDNRGEVSRMFLLGCSDEQAVNTAVLEAPKALGIADLP